MRTRFNLVLSVFVMLVACSAGATDVVTNGLVSWWTFNNPSNPGHDDYGANGCTLTGCASTNKTAGAAVKAY